MRKSRRAKFELRAVRGAVLLGFAVVVLSGCHASHRPSPHAKMRVGMFAEARDLVESQVVEDRGDRRYMLDRMRAGVLNLDAGDPVRAERWFAEVYDVLRTQGLNADKTVSSVVLTEGVKVWKGEPFEQAMALVYYGFVQASQGSWDNARAAAGNALFYLRDFSDPDGDGNHGRRIDTAEIARRAAEYEARQRAQAQGGENSEDGEPREGADAPAFTSGDDYLDHGYIAERNNFTMAYLLHGIASQQLGRADEASDYFRRVTTLDPGLEPLVAQLRAGDYNTILVVADGLGPRKIATGPGGALSRYQPIDRMHRPAKLYLNSQPAGELSAVTDLNAMALDHRWNNLEDVRVAKNVLGDLAMAGGTYVLLKGAQKRDDGLAALGAGVLLAGLFMKATSRANTDYCDVFPQRLFVAALNINQPGQTVSIQLADQPDVVAVLHPLDPPAGPEAAFYYLRGPVDRDPSLKPVSQPSHP